MILGQHTFPKTAALAPMAGVADRAFREICIEMGAAYTVGELASAKGIYYGSEKSKELLEVHSTERPMGTQLFGAEASSMVQAAQIASKYNPDFLDINMGCPAPKVVGTGGGSSLMKNLPLAFEITQSVVNATQIPVTVKIRKGWDSNSVNAVETAVLMEQAGAKALTIHGRTRAQMYAPVADWEIIKEVKQALSIPVIGNGDVTDLNSALAMYQQTGCDMVMIGRGALGHPWIFKQIKAYQLEGKRLPDPPIEERLQIMLRQIALACQYKGEYAAMRESRTHAAWYLKGMHGAAAFRRQAGQLTHYEDLEKLVQDVLNNSVKK